MDERIKLMIQRDFWYLVLIGILLIGFFINNYAASKNVDYAINKCKQSLKDCGCYGMKAINWTMPIIGIGGDVNGS